MAEATPKRLLQAAKDLYVGIDRLVEALARKGITVENRPTVKLTSEQVALLEEEFTLSVQDRPQRQISAHKQSDIQTFPKAAHDPLSSIVLDNRGRVMLSKPAVTAPEEASVVLPTPPTTASNVANPLPAEVPAVASEIEINQKPLDRLVSQPKENNGRGNWQGNRSKQPEPSELQLGVVMRVVEERGFGFLHKLGNDIELFWHVSALGEMPTKNDWVLFAEGPSRKTPGQSEVKWARPISQDVELLGQTIKHVDEPTLHKLLQVGPSDTQPNIVTELVGRLPSISDAEGVAPAIQLLNKVRQQVPHLVREAVKPLLARTSPEYAWQLWLRYRSPLSEMASEAARLADLLATVPEIVSEWLPRAQREGLVGLGLRYLQQEDEQVTVLSKRLQTALGEHELYTEVVSIWLQQAEAVRTEQEFFQYRYVAQSAPLAAALTDQQLFALVLPDVQLKVWNRIPGIDFPQEAAIIYFAYLPIEEQDEIAVRLDDDRFAQITKFLTAENNEATRQRGRIVLNHQIVSNFAALGLDLESDRQTIREIAWGAPGAWHTGLGKTPVAAVLQELQELVASSQPYLLVGHNILDFDAEILAEHEVVLPTECLWDTLIIEMALSPSWRVLALRTRHEALADADLALQLFVNQVLRLQLTASDDWKILQQMLSPKAQAIITNLRAQHSAQWLTIDALQQEAVAWLRPQPLPSTQLQQLREAVAGVTAPLKLLVAAREFWGELYAESGVSFLADSTTESDYQELVEEKVLAHLAIHSAEWVLARQFFSYCRQAQLAPVPATMAPAGRLRLQKLVDFSECRVAVARGWQSNQLTCLTVQQLREQAALLADQEAVVFVVEPELITLSNKALLRQEALNIDDLINSPATKTAWMKFSGGQSYVSLTPAQARELGATVPIDYDNLWLEKHRYGEYRIWGSFSWERLLQAWEAKGQVSFISSEQRAFPREQMRCAVVDAQKLQRRLGVTAFNPETIYRSRYWLLQADLLNNLSMSGKTATVLLVQRLEEIAQLEIYFREKHRYFIPQRAASLGRQLELIHQHPSARRLLIAPARQAAAIIEANYLGPLQVVLESFNLLENFYLTRGSRLFDQAQGKASELALPDELEATPGIPEEEEAASTSKHEILERDLFFMLKLQQPVVQQLRARLLDNHEDNRLWLLDPRLGDFPALEKAWQMAKVTYDAAWSTEEEYTVAAQAADQVLGGVRPEQDFVLDLPEAKKLLQQVFLNGNSWYDYQHPYLDKILPAKTDVLVSLPTGGGKSLLFQAPALYRSSYTNRLSIVVTPLKALMEDQVEKLWELGFYSSVEFINQDKQDELGQIYRRLAGGEISLLFITPERFRSGAFTKAFLQRFNNDQGLEYAVYDEAHCISQWGHEFRPDYLHSARVVQRYRDPAVCARRFPVLLFSATVSEKIYDNLNELFA